MTKFKILRESDSCCRREGEYYNSKLNPRDKHATEGITVTDYTNDKLRIGNDGFVYFYVCRDDGSFCDASGKPFKSDDDARKYVACLCDYDASEVAHKLNKILGNVYQWDMFRRPNKINKITENKTYNTMKRYIIRKKANEGLQDFFRKGKDERKALPSDDIHVITSKLSELIQKKLSEIMGGEQFKSLSKDVQSKIYMSYNKAYNAINGALRDNLYYDDGKSKFDFGNYANM